MENYNEILIKHHGQLYIVGYNTNLYDVNKIKEIILAETDEEDPETDLTDYSCASEMNIELGQYKKNKVMYLLSKNKGRVEFVII